MKFVPTPMSARPSYAETWQIVKAIRPCGAGLWERLLGHLPDQWKRIIQRAGLKMDDDPVPKALERIKYRIRDEAGQPWEAAISRSERKSMLFRLSGSLPRYRNALRVRYWAASCSGREHLWERNIVRRHEPNPTPTALVKLQDRCRSWRKQSIFLSSQDKIRRDKRMLCRKKRLITSHKRAA
jgi:hypothetical protein